MISYLDGSTFSFGGKTRERLSGCQLGDDTVLYLYLYLKLADQEEPQCMSWYAW